MEARSPTQCIAQPMSAIGTLHVQGDLSQGQGLGMLRSALELERRAAGHYFYVVVFVGPVACGRSSAGSPHAQTLAALSCMLGTCCVAAALTVILAECSSLALCTPERGPSRVCSWCGRPRSQKQNPIPQLSGLT